MKAYGYGRASTGKQELTEEIQKRAVEEYYRTQLKPKGIEWGGWHYDAAVSGDKPFSEREQGLHLWVMAERGDYIVASKSDRVFRNTIDGLSMMEAFLAKGVRCVMMDMPVDTRDANAELLFSIQLSVNRWERRKIGERTSAAMRELSRRGVPLGRAASSSPYGWRRVGRSANLVLDEEDRRRVEHLQSLRDKGLSLDRIALALRLPENRWTSDGRRRWYPASIAAALEARAKGYPRIFMRGSRAKEKYSPTT